MSAPHSPLISKTQPLTPLISKTKISCALRHAGCDRWAEEIALLSARRHTSIGYDTDGHSGSMQTRHPAPLRLFTTYIDQVVFKDKGEVGDRVMLTSQCCRCFGGILEIEVKAEAYAARHRHSIFVTFRAGTKRTSSRVSSMLLTSAWLGLTAPASSCCSLKLSRRRTRSAADTPCRRYSHSSTAPALLLSFYFISSGPHAGGGHQSRRSLLLRQTRL